ncbi:MAG: hypothetical protein MRY63_01000 [Neomegalonema sp.]|nr:hypothetical protein [Neomegalonema sp.]
MAQVSGRAMRAGLVIVLMGTLIACKEQTSPTSLQERADARLRAAQTALQSAPGAAEPGAAEQHLAVVALENGQSLALAPVFGLPKSANTALGDALLAAVQPAPVAEAASNSSPLPPLLLTGIASAIRVPDLAEDEFILMLDWRLRGGDGLEQDAFFQRYRVKAASSEQALAGIAIAAEPILAALISYLSADEGASASQTVPELAEPKGQEEDLVAARAQQIAREEVAPETIPTDPQAGAEAAEAQENTSAQADAFVPIRDYSELAVIPPIVELGLLENPRQTAAREGSKPKPAARKTAKPAAPALAQVPRPAQVQSAPNGAVNQPKPVYVQPVVGAAGDGNIALTAALSRQLRKVGVPIIEAAKPGVYLIGAEVSATRTAQGDAVSILWQVHRGLEKIGEVAQNTTVPAGALDTRWGTQADMAAAAARAGILQLIAVDVAQQRRGQIE